MLSASLRSKIPDSITSFPVGSLPFRSADEAVAFILARPALLPFWPELPQKDPSEFMVPRSDRALKKDWNGYATTEASGLFALLKVLEAQKHTLPIVKGQLLGPLSHAFFSEDLDGDFAEKIRAATQACLKQIEWQSAVLSKCGAAVLLVLDEPGFVHWNKLSEAEKSLVKEQLSYLYVCAGERNCFLGLHCCAALVEEFFTLPSDLWSVDVLHAESLSLLRAHLSSATQSRALPVIAAGVVPASTSQDFEADLQRGLALQAEIAAALPPAGRALFAANCGHGLASEAWVKFLYPEPQNAS